MTLSATIAVIGGSGLYQLFDSGRSERVDVSTPYGPTSGPVTVGQIEGRDVAFLPRHGVGHTVAPHRIDYRANVWALASLGARAIISSSAVGGLHPGCPAGSFVVPDQFIDRTWGRPDTFYDDDVQHFAAADPYCTELRGLAVSALRDSGADRVAESGTVVVIQGPRFSTRAESVWLRSMGGDIVNMTQYPEVVLAGELNIGTVTLAFVTDADAEEGADEGDSLSAELVFSRLADAQPIIRDAIVRIVSALPDDYQPRERIPPSAVSAILARSGAQ